MWSDITEEERKKMEERKEREPDLPEHELNQPERMMLDLELELNQPRYREHAKGTLEKFK